MTCQFHEFFKFEFLAGFCFLAQLCFSQSCPDLSCPVAELAAQNSSTVFCLILQYTQTFLLCRKAQTSRLIFLHVQQSGKFKRLSFQKLFVKSQWVKLLIFVIWRYEPHYFLSILTFETQCNELEEVCFKEKKMLGSLQFDLLTRWSHEITNTNLKKKKKIFGELLDNKLASQTFISMILFNNPCFVTWA